MPAPDRRPRAARRRDPDRAAGHATGRGLRPAHPDGGPAARARRSRSSRWSPRTGSSSRAPPDCPSPGPAGAAPRSAIPSAATSPSRASRWWWRTPAAIRCSGATPPCGSWGGSPTPGVPLVTGQGYVVGAFSVVDGMPRLWSDRDVALLQDLAACAASEIELRTLEAGSSRAKAPVDNGGPRPPDVFEDAGIPDGRGLPGGALDPGEPGALRAARATARRSCSARWPRGSSTPTTGRSSGRPCGSSSPASVPATPPSTAASGGAVSRPGAWSP